VPDSNAADLGDRLWVITSSGAGGPWFPGGEEIVRITGELCSDAHVEWLEPGLVSRPEQAADLLRKIAAPLREATKTSR
jgi:hypothetical protein